MKLIALSKRSPKHCGCRPNHRLLQTLYPI